MKATEKSPKYPSFEHEQAALLAAEFWQGYAEVQAFLLTGSCARGKAVPDSCLDLAVLVLPETSEGWRRELQAKWDEFYEREPVFVALRRVGLYSHVDLDIIDGQFAPGGHSYTSGPDEFELAIGNTLAHSCTLWVAGDYLDTLRAQWLPYYGEPLRQERLAMVLYYCHNNLNHIEPYVGRKLYFQAFKRFYHAFEEFLQGLFIARQIYPISYDKWVREQIESLLGLPELYALLPPLLEISDFESDALIEKANIVRKLLRKYVEG